MRYTAGPWKVDTANRVKTLKGETITVVLNISGDAHLIAAAPDLLEALELAHSLLIEQNKEYLLDWNRENRKQIMDAIKKARGKS